MRKSNDIANNWFVAVFVNRDKRCIELVKGQSREDGSTYNCEVDEVYNTSWNDMTEEQWQRQADIEEQRFNHMRKRTDYQLN